MKQAFVEDRLWRVTGIDDGQPSQCSIEYPF
jgi:hypothetical protein